MEGKVKAIDDSFILDKPAILDGSISVYIKSYKGEILGEGCYNAPGFDTNTVEGSGFSKEYMKFSALCCTNFVSAVENDFKIDFAPNKLWVIEK